MKNHNPSQLNPFASAESGTFVSRTRNPSLRDVLSPPKPWSDSDWQSDTKLAEQFAYGYMRQKELLKLVPFSAATLWRRVSKGAFVKPVKLSARITAWNRTQVYQWLARQGGRE
jgi:predicted DNA-binding transcriptional regulator AlpA